MKNAFVLFLIFTAGILVGFLISRYADIPIDAFARPAVKTPLSVSSPAPKEEKQALCEKITKRGIEVDLSRQKLRLCQDGKIMDEMVVSTGKNESQTPAGEFNVISKSSMLYSKIAKSWLPFWVGFSGNYGFHELPVDSEGNRVGQDKIGQPDSLGCVRLKVGDAEKVYKFAEIGTKIIIFGKTP